MAKDVKVPKAPAYERAGFATQNAYTKANRQSQSWSRSHSKKATSRWDSRFTPEEKGAYFRAFVSEATGLQAFAKRKGERGGVGAGSPQLHAFLVKISHRITDENWRENYMGLV